MLSFPRRQSAPRPAVALSVAALVAIAISLVPILYLLLRGREAGLDRVEDILLKADIFALSVRSLGLSVVVGLIAGVIGTTTAWLCECTDLPRRELWHAAVVAPVAIPSYVAAYAWVSLDSSFASLPGAVVVLSGVTYPLVHLHVTASIRRIDPALEEVAASLGWNPTRTVVRLLLPQLRRPIASGVLLASLYVLADFGAVATMRLEVFTWVIHGAYKASFDPNRAAVLASALCLIAIVLVLIEWFVRGPSNAASVGGGTRRVRSPTALGRHMWTARIGLSLLVSIALGFPTVRAVQWVFAGGSEVELSRFMSSTVTTMALGAAVALAVVGLAVPLAWLAARHPSATSLTAERSVLVIHSLPGIVVAISFVYLGTRVLLPIYQTWPIVILGLGSLLLALAVGVLRTGFEQQPLSVVHASTSNGASELVTMWKVGIPMALPAVFAATATVALHAAKELPMTLLLRPSGADTLATRLWNWSEISDDASVGPYALALIVLALPPTVMLALADRRRGTVTVSSP